MNKVLFFEKAVVPTFYLFARLVRNNLGQNRSSLHSKSPNGIKVIFSFQPQ
ncbi:hypothetical protein LEP1GSC105_0696 [Leptospira interrogans str. UI 12758]|uniref:Uncharacterized protein n=1 Tax=Leptospira interrogans str. UI 12758 TaxID=1049938 RepID=A0A0E2DCV8_LEPIR|nr:hypothetical protein LEP1GSC105_0696 [Leptospira interrogans str. UI 12758]EMN72153.1 hypothetical protein LEP1GSC100_0780 [Leptospira interrogans serovar Bataviae str. UI 08561]